MHVFPIKILLRATMRPAVRRIRRPNGWPLLRSRPRHNRSLAWSIYYPLSHAVFKKTLHPTGLLCGEIVGKTIEDRWLTAVCGGKRAILYSVSVSRGRLHFFKRSAQPFLCHVFQEVDSDIQSTPGPGHTLNSGKFAGGKNKEKAEMIFSIFRCFVWK